MNNQLLSEAKLQFLQLTIKSIATVISDGGLGNGI